MGTQKKAKAEAKLTPKQERFCQEYILLIGNATQAAINAGYSKRSAMEMGYENLRKPQILKRLDELGRSFLRKLEISKDRLITELGYQALYDIRDAFEGNGAFMVMRDLKDLPESVTRAMRSIKIENTMAGQKITVTFADKIRAAEVIAKIIGLLSDKLIMDNRPDIFKDANLEELDTLYDEFRNGKAGNREP